MPTNNVTKGKIIMFHFQYEDLKKRSSCTVDGILYEIVVDTRKVNITACESLNGDDDLLLETTLYNQKNIKDAETQAAAYCELMHPRLKSLLSTQQFN